MTPPRLRSVQIANDAGDVHAADWLQNLSTGQRLCRGFSHDWRPETAPWVPEERAYFVTIRCSRCNVPRRLWLSQDGRPLQGGGYGYAESPGYLMPKGAGGFSPQMRGAVRLSIIEDLTA